MKQIVTSALLGIVALSGLGNSALAQQKPPARSIVNIAPDLYRVQNDNHFTVFLVTPEGIIMSDPINRDFSTWLKAQLQTRFNRPVRYVLYTHHDWDHASGGAMDANRNGRIERSEATGNLQATFGLTDANRDDVLTGAELVRGSMNDVHPPTTTYTDRHTITLGGKTVEMIHIGEAHAPDSSVIYFPKERVVFGADVLQAKRFPGSVAPTVGSWIDAMRIVERLDFDIAATGHALAGTKADITALRQYLEELATGVAAGIGAGKTVKEIQQSLTWDKYKAWERYDVQPQIHIAQVYATIKGSE